jgi:hypothetical protein
MPLGERIAHMAPKRRRRFRDLRGERFVGAGDVLPTAPPSTANAGLPSVPRARREERGRVMLKEFLRSGGRGGFGDIWAAVARSSSTDAMCVRERQCRPGHVRSVPADAR